MKKRVIAIVLVLLLAVSLLPAAALADDDSIYVSIGGKEFTALDQTINVGGGTAKLTWEYNENPMLTLTNVRLTQFADLGSSEGVNVYAGIVYAGNIELNISCKNCSITAPKHGETDIYEGIYAEGAVRVIGDLSIKNMTFGAMCDSFTASDGNFTVDSVGGCAVYASSVSFGGGNVVLNTVGTNAVICNSFSSFGGYNYITELNGTTVINLRTDPAYGYEGVAAILCGNIATLNSDVTVNVNADYSGYTGEEPVLIAGVVSDGEVDLHLKTAINMNVKCSENVAVEGAVANELYCSGNKISFRMDMNGKHLGATAIDAINFVAGQRLEIVMKGTQPEDTGIYAEKVDDYLVMDEVYIDLDCADAIAVCLPENWKFVTDIMSDNIINIHLPKGGKMENVKDESDEKTFCTVIDADGKPANIIVLNRLPYIFNDIGDKRTDPFRKAIIWAVDRGITTGYTTIEFRPSAACNRGQVVTFLWRAKGSPEPTITENPFADVSATSPYYKAILWAVEQGITTGFDETHFKPSNPCTRAQVVTFLWRADGKPAPENDSNPFKDVSPSGPYYEAILWAAESDITSGYTATEFRPNATCNRGQIVTFIYRDMAASLIGKIVDVEVNVGAPRNPESDDIIIVEHSSVDLCVPVAVTVTYSGGDVKTISAMVCYDEYRSTLPVPENFIEVIGYGTTQDTVILLTHGNNGSMLLNFNFEDNTAKAVQKNLPADYTLTDRYYVYQPDLYTLYVYDMNKDINMQVMLDICTVCNVNDYCIIGNTVYVRENRPNNSLRIFEANLTSTVNGGVGRGYQTYLTEIASFDNVKDMSFDDTGYNVIQTVNGAEVTTHYDFP